MCEFFSVSSSSEFCLLLAFGDCCCFCCFFSNSNDCTSVVLFSSEFAVSFLLWISVAELISLFLLCFRSPMYATFNGYFQAFHCMHDYILRHNFCSLSVRNVIQFFSFVLSLLLYNTLIGCCDSFLFRNAITKKSFLVNALMRALILPVRLLISLANHLYCCYFVCMEFWWMFSIILIVCSTSLTNQIHVRFSNRIFER